MPDQPLSSHVELLRRLADGELEGQSLAEAQQLVHGESALSTKARAIVEGERNLQHAVGRVMSGMSAPQSLREAIDSMIQQSSDSIPRSESEAVLGRIDERGVTQTNGRRQWLGWLFTSPQRANVAAVAAVLTLIAGAVLFGIYGRNIDDVPVQRPVDLVGNVAVYADAEHSILSSDKQRIADALPWKTLAEAEIALTELLAARVDVLNLTSLGYEFIGAGRCDAPLDKQPSGLLVYCKFVDGRPGGLVSLLIAPRRGCCKSVCAGMSPGEWEAANAASCKRRVLYATDGELLYFLVSCIERDQVEFGRALSEFIARSRR